MEAPFVQYSKDKFDSAFSLFDNLEKLESIMIETKSSLEQLLALTIQHNDLCDYDLMKELLNDLSAFAETQEALLNLSNRTIKSCEDRSMLYNSIRSSMIAGISDEEIYAMIDTIKERLKKDE